MHSLSFIYSFSVFLFLFTPYITANSKSQNKKEIFKQADQFNQPGFGLPNKKCQHCLNYTSEPKAVLTPEQESELFQKCAVDLCGPANKSPKYVYHHNTAFDKEQLDPEIINNFRKTILPVIEEAIQTELDFEKHKLDALEEDFLKNLNRANISSDDWKMIAFLAYEYSTFVKKSTIRKAYSEGNTPYIKEIYKLLLEEYNRNPTKFREDEREEIIEISQQIQNNNLDKNSIDVLSGLMKRSKTANCSEEPSCKKWVRGILSNAHQKKKESIRNKEDSIQQYIKHCKSAYIRETNTPPQTYRENFEDYKDRFLKRAFSNYSQPSRQFFNNYISALRIKMPPAHINISDAQQGFISMIEAKASDFQKRLQEDFSYVSSTMNVLTSKKSFSVCKPSPSMMTREFAGDIFLPRENKIYVSLFSCTFHEYGKQTLAHELAHAMSYLFAKNKLSEKSYGKYKELRKCANKRYRNNAPPAFFRPSVFPDRQHSIDTIKTEEDTADLISHHVFQNDPILLNCGLLKSSKNGEQYESLKILQPRNTHSAPLLRTVIEAIHKRKKLSPTCQQVVDTYSDRINFEPCF